MNMAIRGIDFNFGTKNDDSFLDDQHQDFSVTGTGPMVEIFDDRIEITNPGQPLVDTQRFVDTPPKSRNETLASLEKHKCASGRDCAFQENPE